MWKNKKLIVFLFVITIVVAFILYDSFSQPGVEDLKGNFREVAMYRNENNTGPIIRIYVVTTSDTSWSEMKKYGDMMLHTKYGNTKVYFFPEGQPVPEQLFPGPEKNFNDTFNDLWLAKYEKDLMDQVTFIRNPLR